MKVRFKKTVVVDVQKTRLNEIWDKELNRWDELNVETKNVQGKFADLTTFDGDVYFSVPVDSFEVLS